MGVSRAIKLAVLAIALTFCVGANMALAKSSEFTVAQAKVAQRQAALGHYATSAQVEYRLEHANPALRLKLEHLGARAPRHAVPVSRATLARLAAITPRVNPTAHPSLFSSPFSSSPFRAGDATASTDGSAVICNGWVGPGNSCGAYGGWNFVLGSRAAIQSQYHDSGLCVGLYWQDAAWVGGYPWQFVFVQCNHPSGTDSDCCAASYWTPKLRGIAAALNFIPKWEYIFATGKWDY